MYGNRLCDRPGSADTAGGDSFRNRCEMLRTSIGMATVTSVTGGTPPYSEFLEYNPGTDFRYGCQSGGRNLYRNRYG